MTTAPISRRGFTLIELLVVITIIAVLAGLTLGVTGNVRHKAAVSRAKVEISGIETALLRYKIDNGDYPEAQAVSLTDPSATFFPNTPAVGNPSNYKTAGKALFAALLGRTKYSDPIDTANGKVQYLELKESQTELNSGASYIIDPFGYPYGYYYNPVGIGGTSTAPTAKKSLYNFVEPDIWSTAGETKEIENPYNADGSIQSSVTDKMARYLRWVTNWGSKQ